MWSLSRKKYRDLISPKPLFFFFIFLDSYMPRGFLFSPSLVSRGVHISPRISLRRTADIEASCLIPYWIVDGDDDRPCSRQGRQAAGRIIICINSWSSRSRDHRSYLHTKRQILPINIQHQRWVARPRSTICLVSDRHTVVISVSLPSAAIKTSWPSLKFLSSTLTAAISRLAVNQVARFTWQGLGITGILSMAL